MFRLQEQLKALKAKFPDTVKALTKAGYKFRAAECPEVWTRIGVPAHSFGAFVKLSYVLEGSGTRHEHKRLLTIHAVIVDLTQDEKQLQGLLYPHAVSYVADFSHLEKKACMVERVEHCGEIDPANTESVFRMILRALL